MKKTVKQKINFFDTSALLGGYALDKDELNYISNIVFQELEHIKISYEKDEKIKYKARSLVRYLMSNRDLWRTEDTNWRRVEKLLAKTPTLEDRHDSRLICEARMLSGRYDVQFVTADASQYLLANGFKELNALYYNETRHKERLWKGFKHIDLTDE